MKRRHFGCLVIVLTGCGHPEPSNRLSPPSPSTLPSASSLALNPEPMLVPRLLRPSPACLETVLDKGPFPAPRSLARVVAGEPGRLGHLEQSFGEKPFRLRFLGAHLFDLLDKVVHEGGGNEAEKRKVICAALDEMGKAGIPVLRIWGSLKTTGSMEEVALARDTLALVLDENARRKNPLRFVITLQNHQAGYGTPNTTVSLDDQDAKSPFFAKRFYLGGGFKEVGKGSLVDRIEAYAARKEIREDPNLLGIELVNELDTFRHIASGTFEGREADAFLQSFALPALTLLSERFSQPILLGDMRGHQAHYLDFQRRLVEALPRPARERLVWTTHVYTTLPSPSRKGAEGPFTWKLNLDLELARSFGLPLLVGELGQHVATHATKPPFCQAHSGHDLEALVSDVLLESAAHPERAEIEMALLWGEGLCDLALPENRRITIGAGGDSADIGKAERKARSLLFELRRRARFRPE